ncbi:MAG: 3-methyl-2-oxobutanoate hydroxymethyltransferase [Pseudobacteriovorax sp.]|nr:3-methyl-2-oxobutanoate hydroxymethyltransferase [Pseudobacteriovorax sp.]
MSKQTKSKKITISSLLAMKKKSEKIAMVTCYDAAFAKLINNTSLDIVLVGDSMGNVVLGFEGTISVSMDHMTHHCAAVSRGLASQFLVADMPFMSYSGSLDRALQNAGRLLQEGGAHGVKLEGGKEICHTVKAIVESGIPVMGHLGLTPQKIHSLGGYKVQGRGEQAQAIEEAALALQEAGCFSIVLELVPEELAERVTKSLDIPTIGIGAGPKTDGQVLVLHDLLGFDAGFRPKFLKTYEELGERITTALQSYSADVKSMSFPSDEHSFKD